MVNIKKIFESQLFFINKIAVDLLLNGINADTLEYVSQYAEVSGCVYYHGINDFDQKSHSVKIVTGEVSVCFSLDEDRNILNIQYDASEMGLAGTDIEVFLSSIRNTSNEDIYRNSDYASDYDKYDGCESKYIDELRYIPYSYRDWIYEFRGMKLTYHINWLDNQTFVFILGEGQLKDSDGDEYDIELEYQCNKGRWKTEIVWEDAHIDVKPENINNVSDYITPSEISELIRFASSLKSPINGGVIHFIEQNVDGNGTDVDTYVVTEDDIDDGVISAMEETIKKYKKEHPYDSTSDCIDAACRLLKRPYMIMGYDATIII